MNKEHLASTRPNGVPVERGTPETLDEAAERMKRDGVFSAQGITVYWLLEKAEEARNLERQRDASLQREKVLREALEAVEGYPDGSILYGWVNQQGIGRPEYDRRCEVVEMVRAALGDK
jgi:hypothetical protein